MQTTQRTADCGYCLSTMNDADKPCQACGESCPVYNEKQPICMKHTGPCHGNVHDGEMCFVLSCNALLEINGATKKLECPNGHPRYGCDRGHTGPCDVFLHKHGGKRCIRCNRLLQFGECSQEHVQNPSLGCPDCGKQLDGQLLCPTFCLGSLQNCTYPGIRTSELVIPNYKSAVSCGAVRRVNIGDNNVLTDGGELWIYDRPDGTSIGLTRRCICCMRDQNGNIVTPYVWTIEPLRKNVRQLASCTTTTYEHVGFYNGIYVSGDCVESDLIRTLGNMRGMKYTWTPPLHIIHSIACRKRTL